MQRDPAIPIEEILISVKVIPKAKTSEIAGWENNILKVRLTAAPEKGKANHALIALLSKTLKIAKSHITLVKGETSRNKILLIKGISLDDLKTRLK